MADFVIEPTTAEHVVGVTDAVILRQGEATNEYVADFCQLSVDAVKKALRMAVELDLVRKVKQSYSTNHEFARYLICANDRQRASVFRLIIEQYEPFRLFRYRLTLQESPGQAADKVRAVLNVAAGREIVKDTLINFGTFANAILPEGAGKFKVVEQENPHPGYLKVLHDICSALESAKFHVGNTLGESARDYLTSAGGFEDLATAYLKLGDKSDTRSPVLHAGNAIESFIVKYAADSSVSLIGAAGINSKVDKFNRTQLKSKHQFMLRYLGHIRNAADHGVDPDIGSQWSITYNTAVEYVHVAMSAISAVVAARSGDYKV